MTNNILNNLILINPILNSKIRVDEEGDGHFGTRRANGKRHHQGIDIIATPNTPVIAPISGIIKHIGTPYENSTNILHTLWIEGAEEYHELCVKIFYIAPCVKIGNTIKQNQIIGHAENVALFHNMPKMQNHIHLEILINNLALLDTLKPTSLKPLHLNDHLNPQIFLNLK